MRHVVREIATGVLAGAVVLLAASERGLAHHSAAMFDEKKTVTVEGVVKEFQLTNPHSWLLVDVTDKSGKVVNAVRADGLKFNPRAGFAVK
jgi:hypothetical protein